MDPPVSELLVFYLSMRSPNLENHDSWSWLSEWSIGFKWKSTGNVCQLITPAQVNQRVQKGSSESGFWIEGIHSPDCCVLLPDPCFQLCLTFYFIFLYRLYRHGKFGPHGETIPWRSEKSMTGWWWPNGRSQTGKDCLDGHGTNTS